MIRGRGIERHSLIFRPKGINANIGLMGFPGGLSGKESACHCKRLKKLGFDPWVEKIPWRRAWQPTPVFLLGKSHRQRSLAGYSPWVAKSQTQLSDYYYLLLLLSLYLLILAIGRKKLCTINHSTKVL